MYLITIDDISQTVWVMSWFLTLNLAWTPQVCGKPDDSRYPRHDSQDVLVFKQFLLSFEVFFFSFEAKYTHHTIICNKEKNSFVS